MKIEHLKSEDKVDFFKGINLARLSAFSVTSKLHDHDFAEIFFINMGEIIHKINGRSQVVKAGQVVFIRPDDVHGFGNSGAECEMYNLAFRRQLLEKCADFAENSISLEAFYSPDDPPVLELDEIEKAQLSHEIESAGGELIANPQGARCRLYIIVLKLFAARFPQINRQPAAGMPAWLDELCAKMRQKNNFIKGLHRMQELACCSPEHLCRCFKNRLGQSPTEFINELRINYAASLLIHSDEKIFTIAMNSGFANLSHFYHQFKKIYRLSPAVYRKKQQQHVVP
ncbi:MAG: helix-turn-helix domain-containing protein [Victivallales bacterium]|nr:helix-turn-helix domain-containing protein [Victivallales bacterium]